MSASFAGDNEEIAAGSELAFTMTISGAAYNSMKAEDYIKIEAGFFQEENNWDTMVKLGWPQFSPADFTKNADGTYSAAVKLTFEQKADKFQSLLVRGVGTGFSGSVKIQGLTITRAEGEPVLTPQEATVIGNFAEGIDGWAAEAGYGGREECRSPVEAALCPSDPGGGRSAAESVCLPAGESSPS